MSSYVKKRPNGLDWIKQKAKYWFNRNDKKSKKKQVIVGAHAVMANGIHKLCPLYPHNPEVLLNELKSPSELLDFGEFSDCMDFGTDTGSPLLQVVNPAFDYVPPKLVSLFITDTGGHNPSYMYRLIAHYYSANDLVLQQRPTT
ncbi:translation initiation factor eIF-2B subunit beta [Tanacetum coccineum]|uniref:Translation initiation factor eIF2B subunit beta n=1 Tax=Tanacetum coccineum TaxID=301880 RepID=A0ABQ5E677_9ASTR